MNFDRLVSLLGEEFKKSPGQIHLYDIPMFSIYVKEGRGRNTLRSFYQTLSSKYRSHKDLKNIFTSAKNKINKMGFPSMHVNVLFDDLSKEVNRNTGGGVGGYAHRKGKYMTISISVLNNLEYLEKVIIHEWAHLWMFNNSAGFKKAVKEYYDLLLAEGQQKFNSSVAFDEQSYLIDNKNDDQLFIIYTTEFANLISSAYLEVFNDKVQYAHLEADIKAILKKDDGKKNIDESIIYNNVSNIIKKMLEYYNENMDNYDLRIHTNEHKKILNDLVQQIGDSIIKDGIFNYVKRSIENDLSEYYEKIGHSVLFDGELPDEKLEDFYFSLYRRTDNNKYILKQNNDSYEHIYSITSSYPKDDPFDYLTIIMNTLKKIKQTLEVKQKLSNTNLSGEHLNDIRKTIQKLVQWSNDYGMSNHDEIWATGVEDFVKLPPRYKKEIMNLMQQQDRRELPNRTMRKKMK